MNKMISKIKERYYLGATYKINSYHINVPRLSEIELEKRPLRFDIINYLLSQKQEKETVYLEIGVRNPNDNFNRINANVKYSVDPGVEYKINPVDFKMESDSFFEALENGDLLFPSIKFDVIFIDGLHLAEQVERDIKNALKYIKDDGFIILHDCNPPTEYHAREEYCYDLSPAQYCWNGTAWKAFYKFRLNKTVSCACIDSDWGVGIIAKKKYFESLEKNINPFFEYKILDINREKILNLMSFERFKKIINYLM